MATTEETSRRDELAGRLSKNAIGISSQREPSDHSRALSPFNLRSAPKNEDNAAAAHKEMSQVEPELAPVPLRLERSAPPGRGWGVAPAPCAAGTECVLGTSREDTARVNPGVRLRIARPRGHHRQSGRAGDFHVSVGSGYSC
jgi:hypothetical protein